MKILHISPGPFCDGWTYQDNILTKYHKKMGFDVSIMTSCWVFEGASNYKRLPPSEYINSDGVKVIRLPIRNNKHQNYHFKRFKGFYLTIEKEKPDIIFVHNINFLDASLVYKYCKKHSSVKLFVDNHCDESNSGRNFVSKIFFHKFLWRLNATKLNKVCDHFYGVLPARVDFLVNYYGVPREKTSLLIMGADDEYVNKYASNYKCRSNYFHGRLKPNCKLIVTGGKIDVWKKQTLNLMRAVKKIDGLQLIVFGSVSKELEQEFLSLVDNEKVFYAGWLNSEQTYEYIALADICVFPGRHSVIWEQCVAQSKPLIVKLWKGTTHIDIGGNVVFLEDDSPISLENCLRSVILSNERFERLELIANSREKERFLYSTIAAESIGN